MTASKGILKTSNSRRGSVEPGSVGGLNPITQADVVEVDKLLSPVLVSPHPGSTSTSPEDLMRQVEVMPLIDIKTLLENRGLPTLGTRLQLEQMLNEALFSELTVRSLFEWNVR